jgi:hypothetical protein
MVVKRPRRARTERLSDLQRPPKSVPDVRDQGSYTLLYMGSTRLAYVANMCKVTAKWVNPVFCDCLWISPQRG